MFRIENRIYVSLMTHVTLSLLKEGWFLVKKMLREFYSVTHAYNKRVNLLNKSAN